MITDYETGDSIEQPPVLSRVTAFVTRDRGLGRELLVIRHALARPHLPDETVRLDETPEQAVMRRVSDLTGVEDVQVRARLATLRQRLQQNERTVVRPVLLRTAPNNDATLMRFQLERGMQVRVTETQPDYLRVVYEEFTPHEAEMALKLRRAGWVPTNALAKHIEHHLYHVRVPPNMRGSGRFNVLNEEQPAWVPLIHVTGLVRDHEEWMNRVRAYLLKAQD